MKTICPHCKQEFPETPDEYLGTVLECSSCGKEFVCEKPKFCTECGAVSPADALKCRQCGKSFPLTPALKPVLKPQVRKDGPAESFPEPEGEEADRGAQEERIPLRERPAFWTAVKFGFLFVILAVLAGGGYLNWKHREAVKQERLRQAALEKRQKIDAEALKKLKAAVAAAAGYQLGRGLERPNSTSTASLRAGAGYDEYRKQLERDYLEWKEQRARASDTRMKNAERFLNEIDSILRSAGYQALDADFQYDFKFLTIYNRGDAYDTLGLLKLRDKLQNSASVAEFCDAAKKADLPIETKEKLAAKFYFGKDYSAADGGRMLRGLMVQAQRKRHGETREALQKGLEYLDARIGELKKKAFGRVKNQLSSSIFDSYDEVLEKGDAKDRAVLQNALKGENIRCSKFGLNKYYSWKELVELREETRKSLADMKRFVPANKKILRGVSLFPGKDDNPFFATENGCLIDRKTNRLLYVIPREKDDYVIPSRVTSIASDAFCDCGDFIGISPKKIIRVGVGELDEKQVQALRECKLVGVADMTKVVVPEGMTEIGKRMFSGCEKLASVTLPPSVTSIGDEAFYECKALEKITLPPSVTSIGAYAFRSSGLTAIVIPDGVKSIGKNAFAFSALSSVTLPSGLVRVEEETFYWCKLKTVTIPAGVSSIEKSAFEGCRDLRTVTLPAGLTSIADSAFKECPCENEVMKTLREKRLRGLEKKREETESADAASAKKPKPGSYAGKFFGPEKGLVFYSLLDGKHSSAPYDMYGRVRFTVKNGVPCGVFSGRDALVFGANRLITDGKPCTMSIWALPTSRSGNRQTAFFIGKQAPHAKRAIIRHGGCLKFEGFHTSVNTRSAFEGRWVCYTMTFDGKNVRLYADGREAGSGPVQLRTSGEAIAVGGIPEHGGIVEPFVGFLAQAKLYNRVLTQKEIKELSPF